MLSNETFISWIGLLISKVHLTSNLMVFTETACYRGGQIIYAKLDQFSYLFYLIVLRLLDARAYELRHYYVFKKTFHASFNM